eukprot:TRINITY_DN32963_c0_g1_i1.p1 TRINITY_DN32963_c0_g1~~TRINITY_DN32963_c0_g1_i1.p1  ORF type:complete len:344 (-),score=54.45 TRINITY_DN32963_c0_g1_i1:75-1106(-)
MAQARTLYAATAHRSLHKSVCSNYGLQIWRSAGPAQVGQNIRAFSAAAPTAFKYPDAVVSTQWLNERLGDPYLRVFDCTTFLLDAPPRERGGRPYKIDGGRAAYDAGHIPGAAFVDLQADLSEESAAYAFMRPEPEKLAARFGSLGIEEGNCVVLYSQTSPIWATRVWWLLRLLGYDAAHVLNGGMTAWRREGRSCDILETRYPSCAPLPVRLRPGIFVGKEEVVEAIGDSSRCIVDALSKELYCGGPSRYGRPGHIPTAVNLPTNELVHPKTTAFLPEAEIAARFQALGLVDPSQRVITYCGGGIAASTTSMLLTMLGYEDVALYDASLGEWAQDDALPMEV